MRYLFMMHLAVYKRKRNVICILVILWIRKYEVGFNIFLYRFLNMNFDNIGSMTKSKLHPLKVGF